MHACTLCKQAPFSCGVLVVANAPFVENYIFQHNLVLVEQSDCCGRLSFANTPPMKERPRPRLNRSVIVRRGRFRGVRLEHRPVCREGLCEVKIHRKPPGGTVIPPTTCVSESAMLHRALTSRICTETKYNNFKRWRCLRGFSRGKH